MSYLTSQQGEVIWRGGRDAGKVSAIRWAVALLVAGGVGVVVGITGSDVRDGILAAALTALLARWWLLRQVSAEWLEVRERSISWCMRGQMTVVRLDDVSRVERGRDSASTMVLHRTSGKPLVMPPLDVPYIQGYRVLHDRIPENTPFALPG